MCSLPFFLSRFRKLEKALTGSGNAPPSLWSGPPPARRGPGAEGQGVCFVRYSQGGQPENLFVSILEKRLVGACPFYRVGPPLWPCPSTRRVPWSRRSQPTGRVEIFREQSAKVRRRSWLQCQVFAGSPSPRPFRVSENSCQPLLGTIKSPPAKCKAWTVSAVLPPGFILACCACSHGNGQEVVRKTFSQSPFPCGHDVTASVVIAGSGKPGLAGFPRLSKLHDTPKILPPGVKTVCLIHPLGNLPR